MSWALLSPLRDHGMILVTTPGEAFASIRSGLKCSPRDVLRLDPLRVNLAWTLVEKKNKMKENW